MGVQERDFQVLDRCDQPLRPCIDRRVWIYLGIAFMALEEKVFPESVTGARCCRGYLILL